MAFLGTVAYLKSQLMASSALAGKYNNDNVKPGVVAPITYTESEAIYLADKNGVRLLDKNGNALVCGE